MIKVKWIDRISAARMMRIWDQYSEAKSEDFDKSYEGEIIGTNKSFFGDTYLVVVCTDKKIREVHINKVTII